MKMNKNTFRNLLIELKLKADIMSDPEAQKLIEVAIERLDKKNDLRKVIFNLKQDINIYAVSHGFKLPKTLTKLQLLLDKDIDKWDGAGITLSLTNF